MTTREPNRARPGTVRRRARDQEADTYDRDAYRYHWRPAASAPFPVESEARPNGEWSDDTKEERWLLYEKLWNEKGFAKLLSNYRDLMTNKEANDEFSEFLAEKIRSRINDPATADLLVPKDHGAGMKRMPMETWYYEAYNRPNVTLVDLRSTPILGVTEHGIETSDGETAFDMIVWATGFDGFTGALLRMDIVGEGGRTLRDAWADGPHTYLGVQIPSPTSSSSAAPTSPPVTSRAPPRCRSISSPGCWRTCASTVSTTSRPSPPRPRNGRSTSPRRPQWCS